MSRKIILSYELTDDRIQKFQIPKSSHPLGIGTPHDKSARLFIMATAIWDEEGQERQEHDLKDTKELKLMVVPSNEFYDDNDTIAFLGSYVKSFSANEYHVFIVRNKK